MEIVFFVPLKCNYDVNDFNLKLSDFYFCGFYGEERSEKF